MNTRYYVIKEKNKMKERKKERVSLLTLFYNQASKRRTNNEND
jgi:hypothetical protein